MSTLSTLDWILEAGAPWVRYRALVDLVGLSESASSVGNARADMVNDPRTQSLLAAASEWPGHALKRHNDATHPLFALCTLADWGITVRDPGMASVADRILAHQTSEGALQSLLNIPPRWGGTGEDQWLWMSCDTPSLLYALLAMGLDHDSRVQRAVTHLAELVEENGWRCATSPEPGGFRGPGRKDDPCPIVNLLSVKALSLCTNTAAADAVRAGVEMLLWHWGHQTQRKLYMFGIGTTFRRLKYPFVWYDILHVVDVLSRLSWVHDDLRFREMVDTIVAQADDSGRYTAGSMFRAWKGWEFADKRHPSPWITLLVMRIQHRIGMLD